MTKAHNVSNPVGERFNRLVVVRRDGSTPAKSALWLCRCDCGGETRTTVTKLRSGHTSSCGCRHMEVLSSSNTIHGFTSRRIGRHPLANTYYKMMHRCFHEDDPAFKDYGARGITVCKRWTDGEDGLTGIECFVADMGKRPAGHSLDREDNDGPYAPWNCRWATPKQQANNRCTPSGGSSMIICGLDLATRSGYAFRDSNKHRSSILCGTFTVKGYEWEEKYAIAANLFYRLIKEHRPDFVAIERPEHGVRQFKKKGKVDLTGKEETISTINPAALQLTGIAGACIAICQIRNIPYGTIAATSWRPVYFGKGIKPAEGQDWKDLAILSAQREHIALPSTKAEQRDAAEAIGVCTCWSNCAIPEIKWMQQRFMELRTGAFEAKRSAAA